MLKNGRQIIYMVGLAGKGNDQHRSWTGIQINFWPWFTPAHISQNQNLHFELFFNRDSMDFRP
jgi:hypothetical protein